MSKNRRIKDPLYGYIEISDKYISLIDCSAFQRLRRIKQTGYQALFPSAEHSRFTHSLGVFFLGQKAIDYFYRNLQLDQLGLDENEWGKLRETFVVACLLHDVGHSPFSHTGENFYEAGASFATELPDAIRENNKEEAEQLQKDIGTNEYGKPHEAMSALIGLELCKKYNIKIDEPLFVRAIIGAKYKENTNTKQVVLKNAIISLLNGSLIDVDKLDYVVRDAYTTGFNSMNIDVDRLLDGYTVVRDANGNWTAAYKKSALSVIENVIYANDLERRWVQTHPIILYDGELTNFAIQIYNRLTLEQYNADVKPLPDDVGGNREGDDAIGTDKLSTVFVKQALSEEGLAKNGFILRLLCDDDIIHTVKNTSNNEIAQQLFARDQRYKPIWKTDIAFDDLTHRLMGAEVLFNFQQDLQSMLTTISGTSYFFINDKAIKDIKVVDKKAADRIDELEGGSENEQNNEATEFANKDELVGRKKVGLMLARETYSQALKVCAFFQGLKEKLNLPDFEFAAITAPKFQSAYKKLETQHVKIELEPGKVIPLDHCIPVKSKEFMGPSLNQNLFFIYTTKANIKKCPTLGEELFKHINRAYELPTKSKQVKTNR